MKIGVSTSSLFVRKKTEQALEFLRDEKVQVAEVFLESFCEYNKEFGKLLAEKKGDLSIHSVHTLTTQFEPQLYSINERAMEDSFKLLESTMDCAKEIGAKYYTFHGGARFKKTPFKIDFDRVGALTNRIIEVCKKRGVTLSYENVHWCYYNYPSFFKELKKRCPALKGVLDIKQARQSGFNYSEYIEDMAGDIVTVHLSDVDESGKLCLPLCGTTDFDDLFMRLKAVGFDGALIIESYPDDYKNPTELKTCADKLKELASKYF